METPQTAPPATPEMVWAILRELAADQRELAASQKETDRAIKEFTASNAASHREMVQAQKELAAEQMEAAQARKEAEQERKETERVLKETSRRLGDFTNSFGEIVEYMVAPNLQDRFFDLGMDFQEVSKDIKIRDKKNGIHFQIDVYLQNCDTAMLVEVKADLAISDINTHMERLEKMRRYADSRGDKRMFLGAVAGVVVKDKVREYALSQGLYLAEPSGETFNITPPHDKPKEW